MITIDSNNRNHLTVCKKLDLMHFEIMLSIIYSPLYIYIYIYKQDITLNNPQGWYAMKYNQTKPTQISSLYKWNEGNYIIDYGVQSAIRRIVKCAQQRIMTSKIR